MRRLEAIVVVITLLAIPLSLLARGYLCPAPACAMACCHHPAVERADRTNCRKSASPCGMKSAGMPMPDFGLISPLPPTMPACGLAPPLPEARRAAFPVLRMLHLEGFISPPFQPPRS